MWAYSTIQHLLKQSEIDTNNTSLKERALNLSLTVGMAESNYLSVFQTHFCYKLLQYF